MADVKWIKICTDIFDDEKMLLIESMPENDSLIVIWFKLLCMAGKQNNSGVFMINDKIAYTDEMLSTIFRRPLNTVRLALSVFEQYGMIEIVGGTITIPNWEKHQSIDKMEQLKEQNRKRVAEYRAKQKLLASNDKCNVTGNVTVMECNATDKIRLEEDKDKNNIKDEFETLWKMYPNKKGKDKAFNCYKKARTSGTTYEDVEQGIKNYHKEIEHKKTEQQYIKHGSTWFNNKGWLDDYEFPQQVNNQPQAKKEFDFRLDGIAESGSEYMVVDGKMYNRYGKELNSKGYEVIDFGLEKGW